MQRNKKNTGGGHSATIYLYIMGGLGNQMFQYAYGRRLSQLGYKVLLDTHSWYTVVFNGLKGERYRPYVLNNFNITLPEVPISKKKLELLVKIHSKKGVIFKGVRFLIRVINKIFTKRYNYISCTDGCYKHLYDYKGKCYVKGYFGRHRYFEGVDKEIKLEYTLKRPLNVSVKDNSVSIHIRRGDYLKEPNLYPLEKEYYDKAISIMEEKLKSPVYYIFSNDAKWAKDAFPPSKRFIHVVDNYELEDYEELVLMSMCSNNIIANSTFSWWAAYLNKNENKIVISPKKWFRSEERVDHYGAFELPSWITV